MTSRRRSVLLLGGTLIAGLTARKQLHAQGATDTPRAPSSLERESPRPLPTETFTDKDGIEHTLADLRGRATIVHLWATWCGPCIKELPALAALTPSLQQVGIDVLPVAVDHRGAEVVLPYLEKLKLGTFVTYYDQRRAIPASLEQEALPLTLFLDRQGMLVCTHAGPILWNERGARDTLLRLMT